MCTFGSGRLVTISPPLSNLFNCGTNNFVKNYIFRRLRWLGSKSASHIVTLGYLAIWHGYHLGYFLLFFFEFGCVTAQEQLYSLIECIPYWSNLIAKPAIRPFVWLFGRLTIMYSMGFGFLCFGLLKTKYWIGPLKSLYFIGFLVFFVAWPVVYHSSRWLMSNYLRNVDKQQTQAKSNSISKKEL